MYQESDGLDTADTYWGSCFKQIILPTVQQKTVFLKESVSCPACRQKGLLRLQEKSRESVQRHILRKNAC